MNDTPNPMRVDAIDFQVRLYLLQLAAATPRRRQELSLTWLAHPTPPDIDTVANNYRAEDGPAALGPADIICLYAPELMYPGQMQALKNNPTARWRRQELTGIVCRAIAAAATVPGGIDLFGRHWCLGHHNGCQIEAAA